jgi:hypothetical protein
MWQTQKSPWCAVQTVYNKTQNWSSSLETSVVLSLIWLWCWLGQCILWQSPWLTESLNKYQVNFYNKHQNVGGTLCEWCCAARNLGILSIHKCGVWCRCTIPPSTSRKSALENVPQLKATVQADCLYLLTQPSCWMLSSIQISDMPLSVEQLNLHIPSCANVEFVTMLEQESNVFTFASLTMRDGQKTSLGFLSSRNFLIILG